MPRQRRIVAANHTFHVTQRGVNRGAIFADDDDRDRFLRLLHKACLKHRVAMHAYVLMSNHVHLLLTPQDVDGLARMLRLQGSNYVQTFNRRHERTGPLWQGRFHSSPVDSDAYYLQVVRYIEMNPVRAGMVARAESYPWSSARCHVGLRHDCLLTEHPAMIDVEAYAAFIEESQSPLMIDAIRRSTSKQKPLGTAGFNRMLALTLGRPVTPAAGRPPGRSRPKGDGGG